MFYYFDFIFLYPAKLFEFNNRCTDKVQLDDGIYWQLPADDITVYFLQYFDENCERDKDGEKEGMRGLFALSLLSLVCFLWD